MRNSRGFSLIELLAVITLLGIILGFTLISYQHYVTGARNDAYDALITTSRTAASNRYIDEGLPAGCQRYSVENDLYENGYMDKPSDPASTSNNCKGYVYVKGDNSLDSMENYKVLVSLKCSTFTKDDCKDSGGDVCTFSDSEKNECGYEEITDVEENYPTVLNCSNNEISTTVPSSLRGLAKKMAKSAYLDNGKSEYVSSCSGIKFNSISSDTNGKGIYEIASTKNDSYPIYYYRGAVDNNNVKFAGFCWKAVRTTDTGGVKMIYNGEPDDSGYCTNTTGAETQIGTSKFNSSFNSLADIGYMYGTRYASFYKAASVLNTPYVFGGDVTYSGGSYKLTDTMTTTGTWSNDYNTLKNNHYTCFSSGSTCSGVYYVFYTMSSEAYYITLTNGKKVEDALDEMFVNTTNSTAKTQIDNWYNTNLSSYTNYIEDTIYCDDRSISNSSGWNPNGGSTTNFLNFSTFTRIWSNHVPTLDCGRAQDRLTVSSSKGNGALTYPIGLITVDEVMYAGGMNVVKNNTFYFYTNQDYWTISPSHFSKSASQAFINSNGTINNASGHIFGIRPVISLKSTDIVLSGDGTSDNPYVIKTS